MRKKRIFAIALILMLFVGCITFLNACGENEVQSKSPYEAASDKGYSGTREEWLAALVGEIGLQGVAGETGDSAYALAVAKGYQGNFDEWMKALTGKTTADQGASAYSVACENGYEGTLEQWLTDTVDTIENLGVSADGASTEYELACTYGFKGTFIEWLVSLVSSEANN